MPNKPKQKKEGGSGNRKWSSDEIIKMLEFCRSTIEDNKIIEKPTALAYWGTFLAQNPLENCSAKLLREKYRNLRDKYKKFYSWLNQTGQTAAEDEIKARMMKKCPHYEQLHEILGEKSSVHPPAGIEFGSPGSDEDPGPSDMMDDIHYVVDANEFSFEDETANKEDAIEIDEVVSSPQQLGKLTSSAKRVYPSTFEESKALSSSTGPQAKRGVTKQSRLIDAFEAKSKAQEKEVDYQHHKLEFKKEKWEDQKSWRDRQLDMEESRERHRMAMEIKTNEIEERRLNHQHELDKLRVEKECELQIKLARIKQGLDA